MTNMEKFNSFRDKYPVFRYRDFRLTRDEKYIYIEYDFIIDNLTPFSPKIKIDTENLGIINDFDSSAGKKIVFYLGMVEVVSYLKAACCKELIVECGHLDEEDIEWWKKLYLNGLGEFMYRNGIDIKPEKFLKITSAAENTDDSDYTINMSDFSIVPVGGGKDSAVTAELVKKHHPKIKFFTVNSQKARTDTVLAAGYTDDDIIKTYRTISPELLELNKQGFLNGHTPFSAIVAFLSLYCAYLTGSGNIILSNEASANEANIQGMKVNHQYSKSYEFENDFTSYVKKNITDKIRYFSILRPFNELQIAKQFCRYDSYLYNFRSCNAGSKKNIWCCNCPKCLFVYCMMSPFIKPDVLENVFGENMLKKSEMIKDFDGLTGLADVKPFECVGTVSEVKYALSLTVRKYLENNTPLPYFLERFNDNFNCEEILKQPIMSDFNDIHNIPDEFITDVKEMYSFVSR